MRYYAGTYWLRKSTGAALQLTCPIQGCASLINVTTGGHPFPVAYVRWIKQGKYQYLEERDFRKCIDMHMPSGYKRLKSPVFLVKEKIQSVSSVASKHLNYYADSVKKLETKVDELAGIIAKWSIKNTIKKRSAK